MQKKREWTKREAVTLPEREKKRRHCYQKIERGFRHTGFKC